MSDRQFERAVNDWLEDGSDRTPRSAIDGVLLAVKTTPQERDLGIPWRFPQMPRLSRASGFAAIALVAVVGAGALVYFSSKGPAGGVGGRSTATPPATPSPQPSYLAPGITGWTTYTSTVYGLKLAYPSDWSVYAPATHKWQPREPTPNDAWPYADVFANPESVDGDTMGLWVFQVPALAGADLTTWEGLQTAFMAVCEGASFHPCQSVPLGSVTRMCLGRQGCQPALIIPVGIQEVVPFGVFGDPSARVITVFQMGRPDAFPAAARYGGTTALLKSILSQVDVREPRPSETPH